MSSLLEQIESFPLYRTTKNGKDIYTIHGEHQDTGVLIRPREGGGNLAGIAAANIQIAPEYFHVAFLEAMLDGYALGNSIDMGANETKGYAGWNNKPANGDNWVDDRSYFFKAELNDKDFIWIITNWDSLTTGWNHRDGFLATDFLKTAINSWLGGKPWATMVGKENFESTANPFSDDLVAALKAYTRDLQIPDFTNFFGTVREDYKTNITKNIVLYENSYWDSDETLGSDAFSFTQFQKNISVFLSNIVNPNLVYDAQAGAESVNVEGGYFEQPNFGSFATIGDNNQILLLSNAPSIDSLTTTLPIEASEIWNETYTEGTPGFTMAASWSFEMEAADRGGGGNVVLKNQWIVSGSPKTFTQAEKATTEQQDVINILIGDTPSELVNWGTIREVVPQGISIDVMTLQIKKGIGERDLSSVNMESLLTGYFLQGIDKAGYQELMRTGDVVTFGAVFRTWAYEAAIAVLKLITNQQANKFKARLYDQLYESVETPTKRDNDLIKQAKDGLKKENKEGVTELKDEEPDEFAEIRKNAAAQCALLANLEKIAGLYTSLKETQAINDPTSIHYGGNFYGNRFYSVSSDEPTKTFTNLQSQASSINAFLEATPDMQAYLVPKIKIQKVFTNVSSLIETVDIDFDTYTKDPKTKNTPIDYSERFRKPGDVFKGGGSGIKSLTFEFDGETPATAEKYVKAELKMFFQDFQSLFEERLTKTHIGQTDGTTKTETTTFRYIDLLVNPLGNTGKSTKPNAQGANKMDFYDPSFFRIKVDVGWNLADSEIASQSFASSGFSISQFKNSINSANKSLMLCALDHSIDVKNDGTVELTINYRGYGDTLFKTNRFNALIPFEEQRELNQLQIEYDSVVASGDCTVQQRAEFQASMSALQKKMANRASARIIKKMTGNGMLHRARIQAKDMKSFDTNGSFDKVPEIKTSLDDSIGSLIDASQDFEFFFMGDLLYTILDCQYFENSPVVGAENVKFILTDLSIRPFLPDADGNIPNKTVNCPISSLPIAITNYTKWFVNEILGTDLYNMPVMEFIQRFTNDLCGCFLSEICFTREEDKSIFFRQGNILANKSIELASSARSFKGGDINLSENVEERFFNKTFSSEGTSDPDSGQDTTDGEEPLSFDVTSGEEINVFPLTLSPNLYGHQVMEYAVIYVDTPPKNIQTGTGVYSENLDRGIYHFYVGADRGILKNASWSKQNVQYLRESRMFRSQGLGNYAQLATYYNVSLNLYGNFLLFPGMQFYLDPFGIGGEKFGRPNEPGSEIKNSPDDINFSRLMGIGGYHLVTKVSVSITPEKYETMVDGRFVYSGNKNNTTPTLERQFLNDEDSNIDTRTPDEIITGAEQCRQVIALTQKTSEGGG